MSGGGGGAPGGGAGGYGGRAAIPPALPAASEIPGYVSSPDQVVFRIFNGIDTKSPRPAIDDRMMYWCDGFMPIGPSFLRILPGVGPTIYTAPRGTVIWHQIGRASCRERV